MPHIILERSSNIPLPAIGASAILKRLHESLVSVHESFKMADIKSRLVTHDDYRVSNGTHNQGFLHLQLSILPRDPQVRTAAAQKLHDELKDIFADVLYAKNYSMTVEIRDIDKATYVKGAGGNL